MTKDPKPLSAAAQKRLRALVEKRNAAQDSINEFVEFLQDEHGAGAGWQIAPDLSAWVYVGEDQPDA
jgi:hypothetical protein